MRSKFDAKPLPTIAQVSNHHANLDMTRLRLPELCGIRTRHEPLFVHRPRNPHVIQPGTVNE